MDILRDPIWQFVGVVIAVVTAAVPATIWVLRRKNSDNKTRDQQFIEELRRHPPLGADPVRGKHKARMDDGHILAGLAFNFLNQFPLPVGVLAADSDRLYTPENFGAPDWLTVFRRLVSQGYFAPTTECPAEKIELTTLVSDGPAFRRYSELAKRTRREIDGLD